MEIEVRRRPRGLVLVLTLAGLVALPSWSGQALYSAHGTVVSANPADSTPAVLDGKVTAILPMGNRVFVGGSFTQVREVGAGKPVLARKGLFSFDPATGAVDAGFLADFDVSPDPALDSAVEALAPAPGEAGLFVGGSFGALNGVPGRKLVKLLAANGQADPVFSVSITSAVKDLVVAGNRLLVAGAFSEVSHQPRSGLASLDTTTGALDPDLTVAFTQPRQGAVPRVETIALSPDGKTLVAAGNFTLVGGQPRWQVAMVDLGTRPARVIDWQTDRFDDRTGNPAAPYRCAAAFDSHPRDVDISPDGAYFVVVTTGAFTSKGPLCDTASRWELSARGTGLQPTWVAYDGGDSFTAVAITGAAVYVGGHHRWMNNPFPNGTSIDGTPGPGNVPREGLAALSPSNGLPLPWNPGRDRGEGAWALVSTPDGLWVGSDTDRIGGELHPKLAFFPLAGGTAPPTFTAYGLPGDLFSVGADGKLSKRYFDGDVAGARIDVSPGLDWSKVRGAFTVSGRLYTGSTDGRFQMRSFDGTSFGAPANVDLRGVTTFPAGSISGMFFEAGRLYYTVAGDRRLFYRFFQPANNLADDILGAQALVASGETDGLDWSGVKGLTSGGGRMFWSDSSGVLRSIALVAGKPVAGTEREVLSASGARISSRELFTAGLTTPRPAFAPPVPAPPVSPWDVEPGQSGYWMVASEGKVYPFGDARHLGDIAGGLHGAKAVDLEPTSSSDGYWICDDAGHVFAYGDAAYFGGVDAKLMLKDEAVTSLSVTPSGKGYWIFTSRGRVLTFGDATHFGDMASVALNGPVLDSIPTRSGRGYYMVASDGGIFAFGDARFLGSMGDRKLNAPVQSLVPDPDGSGYWLVAGDGGVFSFDAPFRGSMGSTRLNQPMTGMVPFGNGYLMVASDGGIFNFSDRPFFGSLGNNPPSHPIVSVAAAAR
jgi:hypothetical protein